MTKNIVLNAKKRSEDENLREIKESGYIPAVIYGSSYKNTNLKVNEVEFEKIYSNVGSSTMIGLKIDSDEPVQIIIKDIQTNHKGKFNHIDFYKVDESKKISAPISLNFIGEADAVEKKNGIFLRNMDSIEVECLPGELVSHIDVDISQLKEIGDSITVADLSLPKTFELKVDENEMVATVAERKVEKEVVEEPEVGEGVEEEKENENEKKEPADQK